MQRTYWVEYRNAYGQRMFDRITYRSPEDRSNWHKVEALNAWQAAHHGHNRLTIRNVRTRAEMKAEGLL